MKALEPEVLQTALGLQDELLGPTVNFNPKQETKGGDIGNYPAELTPHLRDSLHAINGLRNSSWFFHSPLQYWSCSSEAIAADKDILNTVNQGSRQATSVNTTLRHSIVFSGKRFEDHRLVSADALVITLIHMLDSPVGRQWERKAAEISSRRNGNWRLYPNDGNSLSGTLYEFRFQPLSLLDDIWLALTYSMFAIYFIWTLSKLRALKSRVGLMVAVTAQMAVSIMSSFTICAIFKVDLSKIPRAIYPLVVILCGLENIVRLINAVIITPSTASTAARMGEAMGQTGHVALAGIAQNLALLWGFSKIMSPQIASFCTFATIALLFDFFYLFTFFASVLSVDVRRTELSDSLTKASKRTPKFSAYEQQTRQTWVDSLLKGEAPMSTRIAGTIMMIGLLLVAQWHFFENESSYQTFSRILRLLRSQPQPPRSSNASVLSVDIHQARTPTSWLKMQDHETAREVIQVIKPSATSFIARVYDPLVFVLNGSDRTPNQLAVRPFLPAAYDFARHQFGALILTVAIFLAAVSLFMNYLLWNELPEVEGEERPDDDPLLSIKTLNRGHSLDVMLLKASSDGVLVSVGLDRLIRVWDVRKGIMSYIIRDPESDINPFPVLAITIDSDSNWVAILSAKDRVYLWNIPEKRWGPSMHVEMRNRIPAAFNFRHDRTELIDPVVVVRHNGLMSELHVEEDEIRELQICRSPLATVRRHFERPNATYPNPPPRIITSSKRGCVHVASLSESGWISEGIDIPYADNDKEVLSILPLPALSSFLAVRTHTVDLLDIFTHKVTHTFKTTPMKQDSLRCFHSTRRRPQCGSVGLAYLALAYTSAETGECILQSYLPQREGDTICFRDPYTPGSKTCCLWRETVENRYVEENPGQWEALPVGYLVGIRKRVPKSHSSLSYSTKPAANVSVRRRRRPSHGNHASSSSETEDDLWEVWSLSGRGDRSVSPLCGYNERDNLLVNALGPLQVMGKRSLAVGLGNVIKIITAGKEKFDGDTSGEDGGGAFTGMVVGTGRRRKGGAHGHLYGHGTLGTRKKSS
jgi:hypothetical protein